LFLSCNCVISSPAICEPQKCNRNAPAPVIGNGVDALSITWTILMQVRWSPLLSNMTMRRLAHWFGDYTPSWPKSLALIVHAELRRRIFAK
jgi:hypothetical protein